MEEEAQRPGAKNDWCVVYRFRYFDFKSGMHELAEDYATEKAILEIGAEVVRETQMRVHCARVGRSGYLIRG